MLAKSSSAAAHYNHLQLTTTDAGEPCVEKFYRALSLTPPALGELKNSLKPVEALVQQDEGLRKVPLLKYIDRWHETPK